MTETNGNEAESPLTLDSARELLQQHIARLNAEQYQIGRILNEVEDRRLAGVGSYTATIKHFGQALKALSENDIRRARAAARRFSEAVFVKYGVRRLSMLVQHGRRLRREWVGGEPGQMLMQVPSEEGELREKPFPECTPLELARAISRDRSQEVIPIPRLDAYCIHLLREGIHKRFAEDSPASVKARMREGRAHVTLKDVSVPELKMLAHAILDSIGPIERETYRRSLMPLPHAMPRLAPSLHCIPRAAASATAPRAP